MVADIGGGDLQGGAQLGGGCTAPGSQVIQDALAGRFYFPKLPDPPSQEGGEILPQHLNEN